MISQNPMEAARKSNRMQNRSRARFLTRNPKLPLTRFGALLIFIQFLVLLYSASSMPLNASDTESPKQYRSITTQSENV